MLQRLQHTMFKPVDYTGLVVFRVCFGAILLCYFAISYPLSRLAAYLEKRLATS